MYELKANFYPASEKKMGYIGKADITIGNAVKINNISVFDKADGSGINLGFAEYGENNSYVVPKSKEAYAAMRDVVAKAVESDKHFGFEKGSYGVKFEARGTKVDEKYADGRYSVEVGDLCTLNGITSHWVEFEKDGQKRGFVSVDMPAVRNADGKVRMYTNADNKEVASLEFQGIVSTWTDKAGKEQSLDYGVKLADAVKKVRKELMPELYAEKKTSLNEQVNDAKAQQTAFAKANDAKVTEAPER